MTKYGYKMFGLSAEQVRKQLPEETNTKAIKRLTAAQQYIDGKSPAEVEADFGWAELTVYGWLNRFEERDFEDALYDDKPPGEEPELTDERFQQFADKLQNTPEAAGYDEPAWTSALAQHHLVESLAYSQRHVQRLINRVELSWKKPRADPSSADEDDLENYDEAVQNSRAARRRHDGGNNRSVQESSWSGSDVCVVSTQ